MDLIDYRLLICLKENSRENATNIGAKINLSTSAVIERIKKLENSGVIEGYTTIINRSALGRDIMAFIYVSLEHPKHNQNFINLINKNNSIPECHYIAGDFDFNANSPKFWIGTFNLDACWSKKEPVPAAQTVFIAKSVTIPSRKIIILLS